VRVQNGTSQSTDAQIQFGAAQLEDAFIGSVMGDKSESVKWSAHQVNLQMAPFDVKTVVVRIGPAPGTGKDQN
jgi:hypothetical protein